MDCEKMESVTSHDLYPPLPVTNCHTFSDPLPLWSVTYFMDGPLVTLQSHQIAQNCTKSFASSNLIKSQNIYYIKLCPISLVAYL